MEYYKSFSQNEPQIETDKSESEIEANEIDYFSKTFNGEDLAMYLAQFLSLKDNICLGCSSMLIRKALDQMLRTMRLTVSQLEERLASKVAIKSRLAITQIKIEDYEKFAALIKFLDKNCLELIKAVEFDNTDCLFNADILTSLRSEELCEFSLSCKGIISARDDQRPSLSNIAKLTSVFLDKVDATEMISFKKLPFLKLISIGSIVNSTFLFQELPELKCIKVKNVTFLPLDGINTPAAKAPFYIESNLIELSCTELSSHEKVSLVFQFEKVTFESIISGDMTFPRLEEGTFSSFKAGNIHINTTSLRILKLGDVGPDARIFFYNKDGPSSLCASPNLEVLEYDEKNIKNDLLLKELQSIKQSVLNGI